MANIINVPNQKNKARLVTPAPTVTRASLEVANANSAFEAVNLQTLGAVLGLPSGTSASPSTPLFRTGSATLVAGTVTVANTSVTSSTKVFLTVDDIGGTAGTLSYTLSAGVSFTINSSSNTDTSVISYLLIG